MLGIENQSLRSWQEFSIEIPDKDADAIHSSRYHWITWKGSVLIGVAVDQAVEYILNQPDGMSDDGFNVHMLTLDSPLA